MSIALLLAGLMGFAIGGSVVWSSQPLPSAQQNSSSYEHSESKRDADSAKIQSLWVPTDSVGLYTLVLCVFTGVLAVVSIFQGIMLLRADGTTRRAAEAATLSAQAAIGVELPIIRATRSPGLIRLAGPLTEADFSRGGAFATSTPGQYSMLAGLSFQNFGRTIAFPFNFEYGWKVAPYLTTGRPDYKGGMGLPPTAIIRADEGTIDLPPPRIAVELSESERILLQEKKALLWIYILIGYRDFLNHLHAARFCWCGRTGVLTRADHAPPEYIRHE